MNKYKRIIAIEDEIKALCDLIGLVDKNGTDYQPSMYGILATGGFSRIEIKYDSQFSSLCNKEYAWEITQEIFLPYIRNRIKKLEQEKYSLTDGKIKAYFRKLFTPPHNTQRDA